MSDTPEFARPFDIRAISDKPVELVANDSECAALASRFGLVAIHSLSATLSLEVKGEEISATGPMRAVIVQSCAVSGDDLASDLGENVTVRFVPLASMEASEEDEEIELAAEDLDDIPYEGTSFDLGEAVAQSLALAIDPFASGPKADTVRRDQGLIEEGESDGPMAAGLQGLRRD
ncbi:MAG: YceD family protein [Alteraurantiacibacter sp.]